MTPIETDILVAGGGLAGQIATLVFARAGFRVTCVDAAPAVQNSSDTRSTAFLMPSIRLLEEAGVFDGVRDLAARLVTMRIVDAGSADGAIRATVDFTAQDAGEEQFGWNIPNGPLHDRLSAKIAATDHVEMLKGETVEAIVTRADQAIVRLGSGRQIRCRLVVAADGRNSAVRQMVGIDHTRIRYGQKAMVFCVRHETPHNNVSTEVHQSGGPFTLVPLAGDDQTRSAVVWMETGPEVGHIMALDADGFSAAVNVRSAGVQGDLVPDTPPVAWPIIGQYAASLVSHRVALIGEAAHVVPPIGAQGLNMSLADIATLKDLMAGVDDRADIGSEALLARYQRQRWPDMRARVQAIDALNRASMADLQTARDLRFMGLNALARTPALKATAIRTGLGAR